MLPSKGTNLSNDPLQGKNINTEKLGFKIHTKSAYVKIRFQFIRGLSSPRSTLLQSHDLIVEEKRDHRVNIDVWNKSFSQLLSRGNILMLEEVLQEEFLISNGNQFLRNLTSCLFHSLKAGLI
jgi:hypothetical protein